MRRPLAGAVAADQRLVRPCPDSAPVPGIAGLAPRSDSEPPLGVCRHLNLVPSAHDLAPSA
jgi:hypothetical protein